MAGLGSPVNRSRCSRLPDKAILWRISLFRRSRERILPHHTRQPCFDKMCAFDSSLLFRSLAEVPHVFPSCSSPAIFCHLTPLILISMICPPHSYLLLRFRSSSPPSVVRACQNESPDLTLFPELLPGPLHTRLPLFLSSSDRCSLSPIAFLDPLAGPVEYPNFPCSFSPLVDPTLRRNPIPPSRRCKMF